MLMPEAPPDLHNAAPGREHQVGTTGKIAAMQAKAVAHTVGETADSNFWLSVLAPDR